MAFCLFYHWIPRSYAVSDIKWLFILYIGAPRKEKEIKGEKIVIISRRYDHLFRKHNWQTIRNEN